MSSECGASRRAICFSAAGAALRPDFLRGSAGPAETLVVTTSAVVAYQEALAGFGRTIGARFTVLDLAKEGPAGLPPALAAKPKLIVAIGSAAVRALEAAAASGPVVLSMVPDDAVKPALNVVAAVTLEIPFAALLKGLKKAAPDRARLGVLRGLGRPPARQELHALAQQHGFTVAFGECSGPEQLLAQFVALKAHADLVWCPPDGALFTPAVVKPLVVASLQHRLPIVGFSESFVRAGAAIGFYPDFGDIGAQTAQLAMRWMHQRTPLGKEAPRRLASAVNSHIVRLLGLPYLTDQPFDEHTVVLR